MVMIKNQLGDYAFMPAKRHRKILRDTKINVICLDLQKKEKKKYKLKLVFQSDGVSAV